MNQNINTYTLHYAHYCSKCVTLTYDTIFDFLQVLGLG